MESKFLKKVVSNLKVQIFHYNKSEIASKGGFGILIRTKISTSDLTSVAQNEPSHDHYMIIKISLSRGRRQLWHATAPEVEHLTKYIFFKKRTPIKSRSRCCDKEDFDCA